MRAILAHLGRAPGPDAPPVTFARRPNGPLRVRPEGSLIDADDCQGRSLRRSLGP
jgi:hypothetical protein